MSEVRGRPFEPGNQMGKGRPKGRLNRKTMLVEDLLQEYARSLTKKCIYMALEGDSTAMRLCMERLTGPRRDNRIKLPLPRIERVQDVLQGIDRTLQAVSKGRITPEVGATLTGTLRVSAQVIEISDLEQRLKNLEDRSTKVEEPSPTLVEFPHRKAG